MIILRVKQSPAGTVNISLSHTLSCAVTLVLHADTYTLQSEVSAPSLSPVQTLTGLT